MGGVRAAGDRIHTPRGLLGAVALVAAAELAGFARYDAPASFIAASWREAHRASGREAAELGAGAVLCFGDSQVKAGLLPAVLTARLGRPAYNLAVVGGQPPASLALFERALASGARPGAVVLGYFPGLLAADWRINTGLWPELLGPAGCARLALASRDGRLAGPALARALLPSLRRRQELRAGFVAALEGPGPDNNVDPNTGRAEARAYRRNWRVNRGAHALPAGRAYADDPRPSPRGDRWKCRPENARFVRRFLALAASRGVPVFWVLPTNAPGLAAARAGDGRDAAYARFLAALQAEYPNLTVIDPGPALADPTAFSDACHLDRDGAVGLSLAVADALGAALSGRDPRRRLALPAGSVTTRAGATWEVEDVARSAVAVRGGGDGAGPVRR